jgi:hypothetical protein
MTITPEADAPAEYFRFKKFPTDDKTPMDKSFKNIRWVF